MERSQSMFVVENIFVYEIYYCYFPIFLLGDCSSSTVVASQQLCCNLRQGSESVYKDDSLSPCFQMIKIVLAKTRPYMETFSGVKPRASVVSFSCDCSTSLTIQFIVET